jgi:hypothetical protein
MPIVGEDTAEIISIPSATLRKLSGSRVDAYTRYVAYRLFKDLNIPVQGARNINSALSNLPVHVSTAPNEKLSFGWGLSNIIRDKAVHEGSYEHLALMIAIGESFHEPVSPDRSKILLSPRLLIEMCRGVSGLMEIFSTVRGS